MTAPGGGTRQVKVVIAADVAQAIRAVGQFTDSLDRVSQQGTQATQVTSSWSEKIKQGLANVGVDAGFSAISNGLKSVVQGGMEFEQSQNQFQAVTQASAETMSMAAEAAKRLGNDVKLPGASAATATQAMLELAKGGLTAQEAMDAARGTLTLAAAAQIDGAQAAEIQANALSIFGLKADQAGKVANVLANAANASSGSMTDFAQALSAGGTVAASFGWTIEDTTTVLGLMANAGIKGSDAGTSLKSAMSSLLNPSKQAAKALEELGIQTHDANGNMITATELTAQLAAAKARMTTAEYNQAVAQAFGQDGVRVGIVLGEQATEGYEGMAAALGNVTGAQDVAAANSKGLTGVIDALKNTVDTASISLFEALSPSIMEVAQSATGLITPLADGLAPVLSALAGTATGSLAPAMEGIGSVLTAIAGPISSVVGWFSDLPGPIGAGVLALGGVIALSGPLTATFASWRASGAALIATLRGTAGAAAAGSGGFLGWIASVRAATGAAATFSAVAKGMWAALGGPFGIAIIGAATALSFFGSSSDDAAASQEDLAGAVDKTTGKLNDQAAATISSEVASSGLAEQYTALGGNVADLVDAIGGIPEKQAIVQKVFADAEAAAQSVGGAYTNTGAAIAAAGGEASASTEELAGSTEALSGKLATIQGVSDLYSQSVANMSGVLKDGKLSAAGMTGELGKTGDAAADAGADFTEAAEKATPFGDALKEIRSAASEADAATQYLSITLLQMAGNTVPAEQMARANAAAMRDVAQAARDQADATDAVSEKQDRLTELTDHLGEKLGEQVVTQQMVDAAARDLADAQEAAADAADKQKDALDKAAESARTATAEAYNQAVAQGDMRGAIEAAVAKMAEQREQFINSAIDAGISREAAEELANAQGLIPENVRTTYEANGVEAAIQRAKDLNAELDKLNNRTVRYYAIGENTVQLDAPSTTGGGASTTDYLRAQANADGGWIHGPGGPRDDKVRARLSPGEFVVNAAQASKHGALLEAINGGEMGFADGGLVPGGNEATAGAAVAVSAPDPAVFQAAWKAIADAAKSAWEGTILPVMQAMSDENLKAGEEFTTLAETVQTQQQSVIQPTYDALNAGSEDVGIWQMWLRDVWAQAWQANQDKTTSVWALLQGATFPEMVAGLNNLGFTQQQLAATTDQTWSQMGSRIQGTYEGQIVPAWAGVQGFASEVGSFFAGIAAGTDAAATQAVSDIGEIRTAMDEFFAMVEGKVAANAPQSGGEVGVTVTPTAAMADGGPITQGTGPRSDDVLIAVSKGEYVVNAKSAAEHRDTLDAINYGGAFADGGMVGEKIRPGVDAMLQKGFQSAVEAVVTKALSAFPSAGAAGTVVMNGNIVVDGVTAPLPAGVRGEAMKYVASKMGTDYVWGAAGPDVFDCSGLMSWALIQAGIGKGRLTADGFNDSFPSVPSPGKPGDMATFDTGRLPGNAGHIGMILDPSRGLMMHTDGAGPARVGDYLSRDGGPMKIVDPIGGEVIPSAPQDDSGDPPAGGWLGSILKKIEAGGTGVTAGLATPISGAPEGWGSARNLVTNSREQWNEQPTQAQVGFIPPGDNVGRWADYVAYSLQLNGQDSVENRAAALNQIRTESSGVPWAMNRSDVNFQRGYGSKGLRQIIGPTFDSHAMPGYATNIVDPASNLLATDRYAMSRYGSITNAYRGVAYDNGGILPPGFTMAYNGTGQNEYTFTRDQLVNANNGVTIMFDNSDPIQVAIASMIQGGVKAGFVEFRQEIGRVQMQS